MKDLQNSIIVILSTILLFVSCTETSEEQFDSMDDYSFESGIIGNWSTAQIPYDNNLSQHLQFQFNKDKTFTGSWVIIDNSTNENIGYGYRVTGTYEIENNLLTLNKLKIYTQDDTKGSFSDLDDLELSNETIKETLTFSLNDNKDILKFIYPPCGPNENCIGSQEFQRVD